MTDLDLRYGAVPMRTEHEKVVVDISDSTLRLATMAILQQSGVATAQFDDGSTRIVTDDPRKVGKRTILYVDDSPGAARIAVDALMAGRLGGFVSKHSPEDLVTALESLECGLVTATQSILSRAADAPVLEKRQMKILALIVAGRSNGEIARQVHLSEATVKREVSVLLRTFKASSRVELAIKSAAVGYKN